MNLDGLEQTNYSLDVYFVKLEFNDKKPIFNFYSGLVAGMILDKLIMVRFALASKGNEDVSEKMILQIVPIASRLAKTYNWNLNDLNDLTRKIFAEGKTQL